MRGWWEVLFPVPGCLLCGSPHRRGAPWSAVWERICPPCAERLSPIRGRVCDRCGRPRPAEDEGPCSDCRGGSRSALDGNRSALSYTAYPRELVHLFKYRGQQSLAGPLSEMMALTLSETGWTARGLTYVPLHPERVGERGFNQAELLARGVAKRLRLPLAHLLERVVPTASQSRRGRRERQQAMAGAFRLRAGSPQVLQGGDWILVDDVYTTGATVVECASVLKQGGANRVRSLTLAR